MPFCIWQCHFFCLHFQKGVLVFCLLLRWKTWKSRKLWRTFTYSFTLCFRNQQKGNCSSRSEPFYCTAWPQNLKFSHLAFIGFWKGHQNWTAFSPLCGRRSFRWNMVPSLTWNSRSCCGSFCFDWTGCFQSQTLLKYFRVLMLCMLKISLS